jgi:hypothetical protein
MELYVFLKRLPVLFHNSLIDNYNFLIVLLADSFATKQFGKLLTFDWEEVVYRVKLVK